MKRNEFPDMAFAAINEGNKLLLHHGANVKSADAHATVDPEKLVLCLYLVDQLPNNLQKEAKDHLLSHAQAIVKCDNKAEAGYLMEKILKEQKIFKFKANMSTTQEKPPIFGPAHGHAKLMLNAHTRQLFYSIEHSELSTNETAAHIHKGKSGTPTEEAEIVLPLPVGRIKEGVLDVTEEQMDMLMEGNLLVNIHSVEYPMGEIRGQIVREFPCNISMNSDNSDPRVGSGNPAVTRPELPSEGENTPEVEMSNENESTPQITNTDSEGQENMEPEADTSAKPAAEPKTGAGQNVQDSDGQKEQPRADIDSGKSAASDNEEEDDGESEETTLASILNSISTATNSIGNRLRNRSRPKRDSSVEALENIFQEVQESNSNLTDPKNSVLKMELDLLNTPEKLRNFATPSAQDQESREKVVLTATFEEKNGRVIKMEGSVKDLPGSAEQLFSPDGKFLGMKAKVASIETIESVETIALMLSPDDSDEYSYGVWMDVVRDGEGAIRAVRMIDNYIPSQNMKDVGEFLQSLK